MKISNKTSKAIVSVVLLGCVCVGSTFAFLSKASNTLTNMFTVNTNSLEAYIDEQNPYTNRRVKDGVEYKNLHPGEKQVKDPTMHILEGSVDSYCYMKVRGIDALLGTIAIDGIDSHWIPVELDRDGIDGIYAYSTDGKHPTTVKAPAYDNNPDTTLELDLEPLFNTIQVAVDISENKKDLSTIHVQGCAVQATKYTTDGQVITLQPYTEDENGKPIEGCADKYRFN